MEPVVVENGAGTINDFLVAANFCHNLLLHVERREGDLKFSEG